MGRGLEAKPRVKRNFASYGDICGLLGRRKDQTKLDELRTKAQGRGNPQPWVTVFIF